MTEVSPSPCCSYVHSASLSELKAVLTVNTAVCRFTHVCLPHSVPVSGICLLCPLSGEVTSRPVGLYLIFQTTNIKFVPNQMKRNRNRKTEPDKSSETHFTTTITLFKTHFLLPRWFFNPTFSLMFRCNHFLHVLAERGGLYVFVQRQLQEVSPLL